MIDKDAMPIKNDPPYKRIDDRPRIITRQQIENGTHRVPDPALYECDFSNGDVWRLKD